MGVVTLPPFFKTKIIKVKITVKANSDFFDRANQTTRRKGDIFQVKKDHAKNLDVTEYKEKAEHSGKEKRKLSNNPGAKHK